MTNEIPKTFQDAAEKMKNLIPQVTFNKNGYEIRAQVLEMAQSQLWNDYHAKWGMFSTSITKEGSTYITDVKLPDVPGVDQVLEAAEKFYSFVNKK